MATTFWFSDVTRAAFAGELDLAAGGDTIKAVAVMENCTAPTEEDMQYVADLTTLDEFDGSGYARVTVASQALTLDAALNQTKWDGADIVFPALGIGTRKCIGLLLIKDTGNPATDNLLVFLGVTPFDPVGLTVTWLLDTEGIGLIQAVT